MEEMNRIRNFFELSVEDIAKLYMVFGDLAVLDESVSIRKWGNLDLLKKLAEMMELEKEEEAG